MATTSVDVVIRNGRVIDPHNGVDFTADVAVKDGKIWSVGQSLEVKATSEFDASGCLVTPGLIDCHVHCYEHATPLGINVDTRCLARGVTTVVDAGSAGSSTFSGLRKFVAERSQTRVLCFLHIANHGLASAGCSGPGWAPGGECDSLNQVHVRSCVDCVQANRDMIVGVKVRLSESITADGRNEQEVFRRSLEAARESGVPLMVHHTMSSVPTQKPAGTESLGCPADLAPGDLYTHAFHGLPSTIVDPGTLKIHADVLSAKRRGVLFDVGHGVGSFSWTVAELCAEQQFWPDIISTDLHLENIQGPAYDLPSVMSKFLKLGMPVADVIGTVTSVPATAIGWIDRIGSLTSGNEADVTVLRLEDCDAEVEDCYGQLRRMSTRLVPVAVWRKGIQYSATHPTPWPNKDILEGISSQWQLLDVRDATQPFTTFTQSP